MLRDGRLRGTTQVADITDEALLAMIIGRTLEATFPPKHEPRGRARRRSCGSRA